VFKNVLYSLWKHISSTKKYTNEATRELAISKIKKNIQEKRNKDCVWLKNYLVAPWIFKGETNLVNKVIHIIKTTKR
jgi:hypothetical protein